MTDTQFFWGWGVYLSGVLACFLAFWFITRPLPTRLRRILRTGLFFLLVTPWWHSAEVNLLLPAVWVMLFDGLSHSTEQMARAGLPLVIVTAITSLLATVLPVPTEKPASKPSTNKTPSEREKQNTSAKVRQEPTL